MSQPAQTLPARPAPADAGVGWADRVETWACTAQVAPTSTRTEEPCGTTPIRPIPGALERQLRA